MIGSLNLILHWKDSMKLQEFGISLVQCPSGINGPLEWHEFSCSILIPEKTTKIRAVLNAGWSSQPNNEATTWFDGINIG